MKVPAEVLSFFHRWEGLNQPGKVPPGPSGVTIGPGFDLGYTTKAKLLAVVGDILPNKTTMRLVEAVGLKGNVARALAPKLKDIKISQAESDKIFSKIIEEYWDLAHRTFPGLDLYPLVVQWMVTSLVFNRGAKLDDNPNTVGMRDGMSTLQRLIAEGAQCEELATEVQAMGQLVQDEGMDGLILRRAAEAELIRGADDPA